MTQTENQQNAQTPVVPTPDLSAVDFSSETPVAVENTEATSNTPVQWEQINTSNDEKTDNTSFWNVKEWVKKWVNKIKDTMQTGVAKAQEIWTVWVQQITQVGESAITTWQEALQWITSTTLDASKTAVQWAVGVANELKQWVVDTFHNVKSWEWIIDSGKSLVKWTIWTTAQVAEKAVWTTVQVAEWLTKGAIGAATNIVQWAGQVVQGSINSVAWAVLPWKWAQIVQNIQDKVAQWAQNLGTQAKDILQQTWKKTKWFFANLRDNFKAWFSTKGANEIMEQASAPLETTIPQQQIQNQQPVQAQQPIQATVPAQQPTAAQPVAANPIANEPTTPVQTNTQPVEQPTQPTTSEVQPGEIQQPTNNVA